MSRKISNLPTELLEEILSRVPVKSSKAARSTCKIWNKLSKDKIKKLFGNNTEFLVQTMADNKVYVATLSDELCINPRGKLDDSVKITDVFHCNGLLLCLNSYSSLLVVWNPYLGQTLSIELKDDYSPCDRFALGYDNEDTHKILRLRLVTCYNNSNELKIFVKFEIYSFSSEAWKFVGSTDDTECRGNGISLNGNTYWYAREYCNVDRQRTEDDSGFLICFDFTTEKFGPHLVLPFHAAPCDKVTISSVRAEQLAVVLYLKQIPRIEIWVTDKIAPKEVSWSKFLAVDMSPHIRLDLGIGFFVDEKKKVVVFFGNHAVKFTRNMAYIFGKDGYLKEMYLGVSNSTCCSSVSCYVPSSKQIKQRRPVMQQNHSLGKVIVPSSKQIKQRRPVMQQHHSLGEVINLFWCLVFSVFLCWVLSFML